MSEAQSWCWLPSRWTDPLQSVCVVGLVVGATFWGVEWLSGGGLWRDLVKECVGECGGMWWNVVEGVTVVLRWYEFGSSWICVFI